MAGFTDPGDLDALQTAPEQLAAEARCDPLERQLEVVERPAAPAVPQPVPLPKVLVVDDQPADLLAMTAVLEPSDQELVTVSSGREALKALLHHDDFAVIIDVQMPEMDGYETTAHIKRRPCNRDVPITFLTAVGIDPEHTARGYAAGIPAEEVRPRPAPPPLDRIDGQSGRRR